MNAALTYEEYRCLVEQAPIMIWRSNITAKCDYFNDRWLRFRGRSMDQEIGDGWADGVHEGDLERCLRTYLEAFQRREVFEMEYRLQRYDGEYRWVFDRGAPYRSPRGEFAGYIGSCIDITEKVEAQEALQRAREAELRNLRGLLPICVRCKRIRNDKGYWQQVEVYISEHSEADFSHGICPSCLLATLKNDL
jgi:PAS domain S-box-containing protein